jgi:hypothetical protein
MYVTRVETSGGNGGSRLGRAKRIDIGLQCATVISSVINGLRRLSPAETVLG